MSFGKIERSKRGTPRAKASVTAKIVHTQHQSRRIELFITEPVITALGWQLGARVIVEVGSGRDAGKLRITPSHSGLLLAPGNKRSNTVRLCLYGDFINQRACAPMRALLFRAQRPFLLITLPSEFITTERAQHCAAKAA